MLLRHIEEGIISGSAFRGIQTKTQASLLKAAAQTSFSASHTSLV